MFQKIQFTNSTLKTAILLLTVGCGLSTFAKEGIWQPPNLKQREADMKAMGLEIPVEKLYNEDGTGLNNAIVLFGRGCTGEIISSKGLLLTNHHCGYGTVQGLSSKEKDYFANGFWAMNTSEELPCPGLTVTFIRKMENVTDLILTGIPDTLKGKARASIIKEKIKSLEKGYRYTTKLDATIKAFYEGNQYWVIISETFTDIRLVGFPPNGIGQFGGDTDNWMFPRHTGDFSMFRVYAGPDNRPAPYSANNQPYQTQNFFTINAGGYKEGDFTMVYGFPARTQEYISSYELNHINNIIYPATVSLRTKKIQSWEKDMDASREIFIKYTSKRARVANGWKKWRGAMRGLKINKVAARKQAYEQQFQDWAVRDESLPFADNILSNMLVNTSKIDKVLKNNIYIREGVLGIELIQYASYIDKYINILQAPLSTSKKIDSIQTLSKALNGFYKNYDAATDKNLFVVLMKAYMEEMGTQAPIYLQSELARFSQDYERWAAHVYENAMMTDKERMIDIAKNIQLSDIDKLKNDPAWKIYHAVDQYRKLYIEPVLSHYDANMDYYNRLYMKAQMKHRNPYSLYPDANFTLRLTYGKVKGIDPEGPAGYAYQTNLDGAIAKDNPEVAEFDMPEKLKALHRSKDYGRWAVNGTVPINFIADNHTSGGNSGSPILNAKGELIGANFDRIWEGTMSDLYFDPNLCRNISVDVRYILFIIEKFGNAGWLLDEMKIVQ